MARRIRKLAFSALLLIATGTSWALPSEADAEPGIAPSAHFGMFFEAGDEAGFSGGFALWLGAAIYPSLPISQEGLTFFAAPGVELRTGPIPVLTGPNELSPQVRFGLAVLGPAEETRDSFSAPGDLVFTDLKVQAIAGYRWASSFGLDNLEGRRQDEQAFRFGVDVTSVGLLRLTDPIPVPNVVAGIVDVNPDGSFDRAGVTLGFGF